MGLYTTIEAIDKQSLFLYVVIFLFFIFFFRSKIIGLNIFLALLIGFIVSSYIHEKNQVSRDIEHKQQKKKLDTIMPPNKEFKNRDDIINFFFSIQDFYHLNPLAYEDTVDNVDAFMTIHKIISTGTQFCSDYYIVAKDRKSDALNSFQTFIYAISDDAVVIDKFNRAHKRLETILNKYLNEMYDMCMNSLIINGYNIYRRAINTGPDEYNKETTADYTKVEQDFTFKFY